GGGLVRLLDERGNCMDSLVPKRGAQPDVAVAGLRRRRANAKRHDTPLRRGIAPGQAVSAEKFEVEDDVVRGEREADRRWVAAPGDRRGRRDGRGGVAA